MTTGPLRRALVYVVQKMSMLKKKPPLMALERQAWVGGSTLIGIDEAGYGCACGSMWVAAVRYPAWYMPDGSAQFIRDSKTTSKEDRAKLTEIIKAECEEFVVVEITAEEINAGNPYWLRYSKIDEELQNWFPGVTYFDGNIALKNDVHENKCLIKGDANCYTIAAASILAKNAKDVEMAKLDLECPGFDLASNQGYLTKIHQAALLRHGPTKHHRTKYIANTLISNDGN